MCNSDIAVVLISLIPFQMVCLMFDAENIYRNKEGKLVKENVLVNMAMDCEKSQIKIKNSCLPS